VSFVAWHRPLRDRPRRYLLVIVGTIFRTDRSIGFYEDLTIHIIMKKEIPTLIKMREEFEPLDFMKI
jgi:hypothetical protein